MKKVLSGILLLVLSVIVTGGFFVYSRYSKNPEQIIPLPYAFTERAPAIKLEAPILITGDRMGEYLARFKSSLAETISANLEKPIKIQSMAASGHALHRTIHELRSLTQWPQILIYQGGSEEFSEDTFKVEEIRKIKGNFELYKDERLETFLILYPWISRIVYNPTERIILPSEPALKNLEEKEYLRRLETQLLLFEQNLIQLAQFSKDRNTLLILTTTPINLDEEIHQVCGFAKTLEIDAQILQLRKLLEENNPKEAYTHSKKMLTQYPANAELFYIHGQIAKRLGYLDESVDTLLKASAFECEPWRASEVFNSIIRKVARDQQVLMFDFARMVENDFINNTTFFDELHPQNLYYEKGMEQLGLVIRNILKL